MTGQDSSEAPESPQPAIDLLRTVLGAALVKEQLPWYMRIMMSIAGPYLGARPTDGGPLLVIAGGRFVQRLRFLYDPEQELVQVLSYVPGPWEAGIERLLERLSSAGIEIGSSAHPLPEVAGFGDLVPSGAGGFQGPLP